MSEKVDALEVSVELMTHYAIQVAQLRAENARLRSALEAVEWAEFERRCPWCLRWFSVGHAPDCARQRALRLATSGADSAA